MKVRPVSPHAQQITREIKKEGITWHECAGCGLPCPFPFGSPPSRLENGSEWVCQRCLNQTNALIIRIVRLVVADCAGALKGGDACCEHACERVVEKLKDL